MNLGKNVYKPISFWSWNGDMRENEIRWQIDQFKEKGFGGFFIHSRAGRLIPYMGDAWFGACASAIDEAKKVGLNVWLYDEDGWPSGFAGGIVNGCGEEYCAKQLRFCEGVPTGELVQVLAAYRKSPEGDYQRICESEAGQNDLYCYYQVVPHYVDIMDKDTIAKFIEVTHEEYKRHFGSYFGTVIKGIFTDEPQLPNGPCWSNGLIQKYEELYRADILDQTWLLQLDGEGCEAFRYRFWFCVNELIRENFSGQINDWCNKNGLIFTGHYSSEDGLNAQMFTSGGVMPLYEEMGIPGIDHLGNRFATPVLMKQVTSVAHQRGIPYVLSESFGCAGWNINFKELLGIAGWQAVFGVNMLCTHLSAYTMTGRRKRDYPAFFSYQEPWWEENGVLFGAIEKLNSMIGGSIRETKVAVLHPMRSAWCINKIDSREDARFLTAQFRELVDNLVDLHVDFDLLDESRMGTASVTEGVVQTGRMSYSLIVVPEAFTLSEASARNLIAFAKQGGRILFVHNRPQSIEGDFMHPFVEELRAVNGVDIQNTRYILQKYFRAYPVQDVFRILDERLENEVSGLAVHYGRTEDGAIAYLFNKNREQDIRTILRHEGNCRFEVISLIGNHNRTLESSYGGSHTFAPVMVEGGTGVLIKIFFDDKEKSYRKRKSQAESLLIHTVKPVEDNALTLDFGRFRINDGEWSSYKAIIHMLDEIYASIAKTSEDSKVSIEYCFDAEFKKMPTYLTLAVEKLDLLNITMNSMPVTKEFVWWIDKGIMKYDVSGMIKNGMNTVQLDYMIPSTGQVNNLHGKFESERNRFFYQVEPESIYLCGDFDVRCNAEVIDHYTHYWVKYNNSCSKLFTLVDTTKKTNMDLTLQGMWFYRGDCEYSGQWSYDGSSEVFVSVAMMRCIGAKVIVNGEDAGLLINRTDEIDITPHLVAGANTITIVALGHNRNLLGPHHHIKGATYFVGQHTYAGIFEFEDFVSPEIQAPSTWTDDYSFVPFGLDGITVKSLRK